MTRPHTIIGSALATAVVDVLVASVVVFALTPAAARIEPQKLTLQRLLSTVTDSRRRRLGPVLAPGDWRRDRKL